MGVDGHTLLRVDDLSVDFSSHEGTVHAVNHVSFTVDEGELVGLVGESGCGKSTTGRAILQLVRPMGGRAIYEGHDLAPLRGRALRCRRRRTHMTFQDPCASLNGRMRVGDIIAEPLLVHGWARRRSAGAACASCWGRWASTPDPVSRYPHESGGGQRQRTGIARTSPWSPTSSSATNPSAPSA